MSTFEHYCAECGQWAVFGYDVCLREDRLGRWYCAAHRPSAPAPDGLGPSDAETSPNTAEDSRPMPDEGTSHAVSVQLADLFS